MMKIIIIRNVRNYITYNDNDKTDVPACQIKLCFKLQTRPQLAWLALLNSSFIDDDDDDDDLFLI